MARRYKQPKPTVDGVISKIERAERHFQEFQWEWSKDERAYTFVGQVAANGVDHVYFPEHIPPVRDVLALSLGDCIHNLRSAIDHIAYLLAKSPHRHTAFPVLDARPYGRTWYGRKRIRLPRFAGGIAPRALYEIDAVQPYYGTKDGTTLLRIHELDCIDKHRHLFVTASSIHSATMASFPDSPDTRPPIIDQWYAFGKPLVAGQAIARFTYAVPYVELDPTLNFAPQVILGEGSGSIGTLPVRWLIGPMISWVQDELLPRFQPFFR